MLIQESKKHLTSGHFEKIKKVIALIVTKQLIKNSYDYGNIY